jgi:uncharacterized membrane protein YfcA
MPSVIHFILEARVPVTVINPAAVSILSALALLATGYIARWFMLERERRSQESAASPWPTTANLLIGFVTNFFDTLGIGSFAPTTAVLKLMGQVPDEQIPGTLNAGHALPTLVQALIFIAVVTVDPFTLISIIGAAVLGAWLGVRIVSRLRRRAIQLGMGAALLIAASLFLATNLRWMPGGGEALALHGSRWALAVGVSVVLGGLMMLGIGLYAPCLILVSLLGMDPLAAFPIMMGACAFLMPIGGAGFIKSGRYNLRAALGLTLGGIPGVLVAAFIVKSLPMIWLRWLVVVVVTYTAVLMIASARRTVAAPSISIG